MSVGFLARPSSPVKSKGWVSIFYGISTCFNGAIRCLRPYKASSTPTISNSLIDLFNEACPASNENECHQDHQANAWKAVLSLTLHHDVLFVSGPMLEHIITNWERLTPHQKNELFSDWSKKTNHSNTINWPALTALQSCWHLFSEDQQQQLIVNGTTRLPPPSSNDNPANSLPPSSSNDNPANSILPIDFFNKVCPDLKDKQRCLANQANAWQVLLNLTLTPPNSSDPIDVCNEACADSKHQNVKRTILEYIKENWERLTPHQKNDLFSYWSQEARQSHHTNLPALTALRLFWPLFSKDQQQQLIANKTPPFTPESIRMCTYLLWPYLEKDDKNKVIEFILNDSCPSKFDALGDIFYPLDPLQQRHVLNQLASTAENHPQPFIDFLLQSPNRYDHIFEIIRYLLMSNPLTQSSTDEGSECTLLHKLIQESTKLEEGRSKCILSRYWYQFSLDEQKSILMILLAPPNQPLQDTFRSLFSKVDIKSDVLETLLTSPFINYNVELLMSLANDLELRDWQQLDPKKQELIFKNLLAVCSKPLLEPFSKPLLEPFSKPLLEPFSKPLLEPFSEPLLEPFSEPLLEPFSKPLLELFLQTFKLLFSKLDITKKSDVLGHIIEQFTVLEDSSWMCLATDLVLFEDFFATLNTAHKQIMLQLIFCMKPAMDTNQTIRLYNALSSDEKKQFIKFMACLYIDKPETPALQQLVNILIEYEKFDELQSWIDYSHGLPYFQRLIDILGGPNLSLTPVSRPIVSTQRQNALQKPTPQPSHLLKKWVELAIMGSHLKKVVNNVMDYIVHVLDSSHSDYPELYPLFHQTIQSGTDESIQDASRILIAIISTGSTKLIGFFCKWILDLKSHDQTILLRRLAWCFRDQKTVLDDWVSKASPSRSHQSTHQQNIRDILFGTIPHDDIQYDDAQSPPILCTILSTQLLTLRNELKSQLKKWDNNQLIPVMNQLRHILTSSRHCKIHFDSFDYLIVLVNLGNPHACSILIDIITNEVEADRFCCATNQISVTQCRDRLLSRFPTIENLPPGLKLECSRFYA